MGQPRCLLRMEGKSGRVGHPPVIGAALVRRILRAHLWGQRACYRWGTPIVSVDEEVTPRPPANPPPRISLLMRKSHQGAHAGIQRLWYSGLNLGDGSMFEGLFQPLHLVVIAMLALL